MRRITLLSGLLAAALVMSSCNNAAAVNGGSAAQTDMDTSAEDIGASGSVNETAAPAAALEMKLPEDQISDFTIETEDPDGYSVSGNTYTIKKAGTYDCSGSLPEGQLIVDAGKDDEVKINLNGCTIASGSASPLSVISADNVEITAKKGTENKIYDMRKADGAEASGAAIYAECDVTVKGNGVLEVISGYNNGIQTKDDLRIKNLTLAVSAPDNAIKGSDSVTIESGDITVISTGGDAVKTSSTDVDKKGGQRGAVTISGGSVSIYAACDGIDSASDVVISDEARVEIFTDEYSPYSGEIAASGAPGIYLRIDEAAYQAGYSFSAYFYNSDGSYKWVNAELCKQSSQDGFDGGFGGFGGGFGDFGKFGGDFGGFDGGFNGQPPADFGGEFNGQPPADFGDRPFGDFRERKDDKNSNGGQSDRSGSFDELTEALMGGFDKSRENGGRGKKDFGGDSGRDFSKDFGGMRGGGGSTYYYYAVEKPAGFESVLFYAYSEGQERGQSESFAAVSYSDTTLNDYFDTYAVTSVTDGRLESSGWTRYSANSGNSGTEYSCKGIKAGNEIVISGGTVNIRSSDDGIHANFDTVMEATGKKGLGNVKISGGSITIESGDDGIHADQDLCISGGNVNISNSYEGLEANRIYISDGSAKVYARDDALNANSKGAYDAYIEISGGCLDAEVPGGDTDTVDSNGTLLISGGTVFLKNGQMSGNSFIGGTIDTERGVTVTGGTVISAGCIGDVINGSAYSASQTLESGDYTICDDGGSVIESFTLNSSFRAYMFSSDKFTPGQTYTVYRNSGEVFTFTA